jgi:DNA-directed RNA polymerase specialized sigma24 family protein
MPHPNDLDLAGRVIAADRAAFDQLYERFFPRVLAYARRRLGPGLPALTVTEESLAELIRALPRYAGAGPLDAFALEIVRRRVANARARSARPLAFSALPAATRDPRVGAGV